MNETDKYIRKLLQQQGVTISEHHNELFHSFVCAEENINNVKNIRLLQENMTKDWKVIARRAEINAMQFAFPNGIAGKQYQTEFDFKAYGLEDIISYNLSGFADCGLEYDIKAKVISGIPKTSGDITLFFSYNFEGEEEDAVINHKKVTIIINPDPKSLWKDIPSDVNDVYAKRDNIVETVSFLGLRLMIASKRGRSHANKGSFRDDDYAYSELQDGWGILTISDGAGSAVYSRKGSLLACNAVVNYFAEHFTKENTSLLDEAITTYQRDHSIRARLLDIAVPHLSGAAKQAYADIEDFAAGINVAVSDFHATLAFLLVKKFPEGYAFLSFAAGDCPIVLVDKSFEWVKPLNRLDVGEYGGGTRFITMENIFTKNDFEERFNFEFTFTLPHVVLMTDGIYDPKFEVEANLFKQEKWQTFFEDLGGNNNDGINVFLTDGNTNKNLSDWMDFWSPGNHDDRTLMVLS
jgi:hypothetical protein